ncbi:MAG: pyridoxamine 5'-phosphate oxidase family protein [Prevotellaceae bacterium]|jgi:uncharacterized pyridoxamine 5'-phosphate oxidase family protein|nr:pyridoxamine 5'-phosphate oxidase family protein [Prevotellaceae bacterium]
MKKIAVSLIFLLLLCQNGVAGSSTINSKEEKSMEAMQETCDFLKKCGAYFIATVEGNQPRVRPFGTAAIFENKLYIQTGKKKKVSQQMQANPKIEICALDEAAGRWVRIEATVVNDDRREAKQFLLDCYPNLKSMYSADDGNHQVLYLKDATATFSSFAGESRVVKF